MDLLMKTVAYRNAPAQFIEDSRKEIKSQFPEIRFRFVNENPDAIFFLSGGSEQEAIKSVQSNKYYLFLAGVQNNAYAAASEVKAWADSKGVISDLLLLPENSARLTDYAKVCQAFNLLKGKQAGLIGEVSHWLVASGFPLILAKEKFGINIRHLPWSKLPDYLSYPPDPDFTQVFKSGLIENLENEARIYTFLKAIINENQLDGLTLECFEMVNNRSVTACLALALLNSQGVVAGCEGDLVSLTGMMLVKALTGIIPWMANLANISGSKVLFAHCTVPLDLVSNHELRTHFETGKSAALQGSLKMEEVTVFRLNQNLDKAFISTGRIVAQPHHNFACRTQSEVELPAEAVAKLREHPLGNHHLIFPGNHENLLRWACKYKQIMVV